MPEASSQARVTMLQALAPGVLVGLAVGLLDTAWIHRAWDAPGLASSMLALVSCVGLLSPMAVLASALARPVVRRFAPAGFESRLAGLAVGGALVLSAIDALVFRSLYATAHVLLGLASVGLLALAAALLTRERVLSRNISAGLALLAALALWGASQGLDSFAVRSALLRHGNLSAHLVAWVPMAAHGEEQDECPWPSMPPLQPGGEMAGESVLVISVDALRADLLADGFEAMMPNTARRMRGATIFRNAHAPAPRTSYSTYSMITGRFPHRLGFIPATVDTAGEFHRLAPDSRIMLDPRKWKLRHRYPLGDQTPTLAGFVGAAGYRTLTVPTDDGLLPGAGITREFEWNESQVLEGIIAEQVQISPGSRVVDAVEARLEACQPGQPLFTWLHFLDPHDPYIARAGVSPDASPKERYASEVRDVDQTIERLFEVLENSACKPPKVVVFTSDHGEAFGEHGTFRHGVSVYDELIRVPLRVWVEGWEGSSVDTPVSLTDVAPTLLDLLGQGAGQRFDGRSLGPALRGQSLDELPLLVFNTSYTTTDDMTWGVVQGPWKLIENPARRLVELYQRSEDPGELRNLADTEPQMTRDLRCLMRGLPGR